MKQNASTTTDQKQIVAMSRAIYRGINIWETLEGCTFFVGKKQFDCLTLDEAKAAIDAMYALVLK